MKKLSISVIAVAVIVILAGLGMTTVNATGVYGNDITTNNYYTKASYQPTSRTSDKAGNVVLFNGVSDPNSEMNVADLFVGNGNADVTNTVHYTRTGNRLTVAKRDLPAGVSTYYVEVLANGKQVKIVEVKNSVQRTRIGYSDVAQTQKHRVAVND